ncbi:MAG TPA: hypothetical protein PLQ13_02580 [Candidatus Krumholzibacteria bacterium]|nr:hypothetical protein [Candidatus Krumholzibacteria bacterium]
MAEPNGSDNRQPQAPRGGRPGGRRGGGGGRSGGRPGGSGGSGRGPGGPGRSGGGQGGGPGRGDRDRGGHGRYGGGYGGSNGGGPRPASADKPEKTEKVNPAAVTLALSSWDLARTRRELPDTPRGLVMTLRSHKRLLETYEAELALPEADRSYLRVREDATGSVLLVPGVSTRPGDLHMLAAALHEAKFNVYVIRLSDQGETPRADGRISWAAGLEQVRQRYRLMARGSGHVHVVGLGFGATLALHLASLENVASLVLLSPAIMPRESLFQRMLVRMKLHRVAMLQKWIGWDTDTVEGMDTARGKLGNLKIPLYGAQCEDDERASPHSVRILQRKTRHPDSRFRIFPVGGHAILTSHGEETLYEDIVDFCSGR